jgi:LPS O-antigen subunit length determinant protein (WzzB/FepE family)
MSEAETALIAAGIAAVTTFVGAVITAVVAIRNERQRSQATKQEAFVQELRSRTADVFGQLLAMQHSMEWLTWHAQRDPASVSRLHEQY